MKPSFLCFHRFRPCTLHIYFFLGRCCCSLLLPFLHPQQFSPWWHFLYKILCLPKLLLCFLIVICSFWIVTIFLKLLVQQFHVVLFWFLIRVGSCRWDFSFYFWLLRWHMTVFPGCFSREVVKRHILCDHFISHHLMVVKDIFIILCCPRNQMKAWRAWKLSCVSINMTMIK